MFIKNSINNYHYQVIFYPKYYYELNHIKYFWYFGKEWTYIY